MFVQNDKQSEKRLHNLQAALVQTPAAASCALIKMPWPVCVAPRAVSVLHILIMITAKQFLSLGSWLSQRLSRPFPPSPPPLPDFQHHSDSKPNHCSFTVCVVSLEVWPSHLLVLTVPLPKQPSWGNRGWFPVLTVSLFLKVKKLNLWKVPRTSKREGRNTNVCV